MNSKPLPRKTPGPKQREETQPRIVQQSQPVQE